MPKLKYALPSYCHHKASGNAFVVLNGRQIYLGPYGTPESHRAYNRVTAEWLATDRTLPTTATSTALMPITVDEVIARYYNFARGYYVKAGKATSEVSAIRSAACPLSHLYADIPAVEFTPLALRAVRDKMIRAGLCRRTINAHTGRIRRMFRWAVSEGIVPPAVMQGLTAVAGLRRGRSAAKETERVRPVPEDDIQAILPLVSKQVAAMIQVQLYTGMRPGEVTTMRVCELNMKVKPWEYRPSSHKTEHHDIERIIHVGPRARTILAPFLRPDPIAFLFDPAEAEAERNAERRTARKTPLWPSHIRAQMNKKRGRPRAFPGPGPYTQAAYCRAINRACREAGIPPWHPHQLRHNNATRVRRELGIEAARAVLGHSSADVTEIYAEMDRSKALDAMERLG